MDPNQIFGQPEDNRKYRYFNQPIEQIPNFLADVPQILAHRPNGGLQWVTVDQYINVVTCMKLEADKIKVERKEIVIFKDFDIPNDVECNIQVTDCPSPS